MTGARGSLTGTLIANGLLRIAGSASGTLIGLYLVTLQAKRPGLAGAGMAGTLGAMAFAAELLFSIPLGMLADAWRPRWVMVAGALLGAAATELFALTGSSSFFYLSRFLEGISVAAITPPLLAWLTDRTDGDVRVRARGMSLFELSLFAGVALGGVAATQLWTHFQSRSFSVLAGGYLGAALLLGVFTGTDSAVPQHTALQGLRLALRDKQVQRLAPVWLCVNAVSGLWLGPTLTFLLTSAAAPGSNQFFDGLYASDSRQLGWVLLVYAALFAVGVLGWSLVLVRVGIRRAMLVSLAAMLPVCLGFYLVNHAGGAGRDYRWTIGIATAALILVETGFTPAALSWLAGSLHDGLGRGSAMGIYSVLLSLGAMIGSVAAGWLGARFRFDGLLLGTVLLAIAGLLLMALLPTDAAGWSRGAR